MARYYQNKKTEADSLTKLTVFFLKKHGYFGGWMEGTFKWTYGYFKNEFYVDIRVYTTNSEPYLTLIYTNTNKLDGSKKNFDYNIPLVITPCYFGGKRYWFKCPWYANGAYCGRRVATLYLGADYFACRHCYDLSYISKNENRRHDASLLFKLINEREEMYKLDRKRQTYKGKPTRHANKIFKLVFNSLTNSRKQEYIQRIKQKGFGR